MTDRLEALTALELSLLRQADGQVVSVDYSDRHAVANAVASLERAGLIQRYYEDDQPTASTTTAGHLLLTEAAS